MYSENNEVVIKALSTKSHLLPTSSDSHNRGHISRHITKHNQASANTVHGNSIHVTACKIGKKSAGFSDLAPCLCIGFGLEEAVYIASGCNRNHVLSAAHHVEPA